jgi:pimeloyl-ACP methyl ester carboxylesterase
MIRLIILYCCLSTAVADIKVHCLGQGPLVYLIGGGPAFTTWNLQPIQIKLSKGFRVCRWDMRGVGDNAQLVIAREKTALSQWIQDMHAQLPSQPVILWGHSWGALQVLLFAKRYPERVDKLILSNPVDPALQSIERIERKRFFHPEIEAKLQLEDIGTQKEKQHNFYSKIASYFVNAKRGWDYALGFTQKDSNNVLNIRIWDEYRQAPLTDTDIRLLADKIRGLIYCENDVLQPENLSEYRRVLTSSIHHVLTGCAHFPWEENPVDYFQILFRLINNQ